MPSKPARGSAGDGKFMSSCHLAIIGRPGNKSPVDTQQLLEAAGGKVLEQVTKATHVLIAEKPSVTPDVKAAQAKGIPLVSYRWLKASLESKRMQDVGGYTVLGSNQPSASSSSSKGDTKSLTSSSSSITTNAGPKTSMDSKVDSKTSTSSKVDNKKSSSSKVDHPAKTTPAALATKKSSSSSSSSKKDTTSSSTHRQSGSSSSSPKKSASASSPKKATSGASPPKKTESGASKRDAVVISDDDSDSTMKQTTTKKTKVSKPDPSNIIDLTTAVSISGGSSSSSRKAATTAGSSSSAGLTRRAVAIVPGASMARSLPTILTIEDTPSPAATSLYDESESSAMAVDPPPSGPQPRVDPESGRKATHRVLENRGDFFLATLNRAEIGGENTFSILQALAPKKIAGGEFLLFTRRGTIGQTGKTQISSYKTAQDAMDAFDKVFQIKSGLQWRERFAKPVKGKYALLIGAPELEEDDDDGEGGSLTVAETRLPAPVYELGKMVFNKDLFEATLKQMGYDSQKTPLGALSPLAIERGYEALGKLSEAIAAGLGEEGALDDLISEYYTNIPHAVARGEQLPRIADSAAVEKERQLCDSLRDMSIGMSLMCSRAGEGKQRINPVDASIKRLNLKEIVALSKDTVEYKMLERAAVEGQGWSHGLNFDIVEIFRVERHCEDERFAQWQKLTPDNRQLLWHGSRLANFGGILSEGLRVAPSTAPANGYMFGKGIYFADVTTKSINYCYKSRGVDGLLLLCEVQLGEEIQMTYSDGHAAEKVKAQNKHSIFGRGQTCHTAEQWVDAGQVLGRDELKGVKMPIGKPQQGGAGQYSSGLIYNEHIVYDEGQIRFRYLFRLKLKNNGH